MNKLIDRANDFLNAGFIRPSVEANHLVLIASRFHHSDSHFGVEMRSLSKDRSYKGSKIKARNGTK